MGAVEDAMSNWQQELTQIRLALANVGQLKQVAEEVEASVCGNPEAAEELIRPCGQLLQRLIEAQGTVETLLEKLFVASRAELARRD
jgi:hypothetical protein